MASSRYAGFLSTWAEVRGDNIDAEYYCGKLFRLKNAAEEYLSPNIKIVISLLLILPFSNASVERKFSVIKHIKTENRNRLNTDTVVSFMAAREGIKKLGGSAKSLRTKCFRQKYGKNNEKINNKYYLKNYT